MMSLDWGTPGAGKTHNLMKYQVLPALASGRTVFTNISGLDKPSCLAAISKYTKKTPKEIEHLLTVFPIEGRVFIGDPKNQVSKSIGENLFELVRLGNDDLEGDLIVLDEASDPELFDSENRSVSPEMWIFFKKHRHYNVDICLMAHHPRDLIPKIARLCAEYTYYRKLIGVNDKKFRYEKWLAGYSSSSHGTKVKESSEYYDKKIFPCYKSTVAGDGTKDGNMDSRFSIWKSAAPKALVAGFLMVFLGGYIFYSTFLGSDSILVNSSGKSEVTSPAIEGNKTPSVQGVQQPNIKQPEQKKMPPEKPNAIDLLFTHSRLVFEGYTVLHGKTDGYVSFWHNDAFKMRLRFSELRSIGAKMAYPKWDSSYMKIKYKGASYLAFAESPRIKVQGGLAQNLQGGVNSVYGD